MINYIRIQKFCELTGWSKSWVDRRIGARDELKWVAGREYFQLPNGRIVISIKGYEAWVEKGQASESSAKAPSKSVLPIRENAAVKDSSSSPPPLI